MKLFLFPRYIVLIAGALALSACQTVMRTDVATFHDISAPGGERVMLAPIDESKTDSLEFRQYAGVLAKHLQSYGYKEAGDNAPELIAGFDVTINDGREKIETRPDITRHYPYWDVRWRWGSYWRYDPFYHDRHFNDRLVAKTVYNITLTLELRKPDGEKVFEGRAETEVRSKAIPEVLPFLAEALFETFPGENGKTRRVVIELDKDK